MLNWEIKKFVLIALFFSTCILPVLTISVMALNPRFNYRMDNHADRVLPLLFAAIYYYIGYFLLKSLHIFPVIKIFLVASVILIVVLLVISIKWKISNHLAAIGAYTGTILAVSFRSGTNPVLLIIATVLVAGLVGTARIYLGKHTLLQVLAGYTLGLVVLYLAVLYS